MRTFLLLALLLAAATTSVLANHLVSRPDRKDVPRSARWLVAGCDWGVLGTLQEADALSSVFRKAPVVFTNVVSFADGEDLARSSGIPYFYLAELDQSTKDVLKNNKVSFTMSEKQSEVDGRCGKMDAQDPPCARITLSGRLIKARNAERAKSALFAKHPNMARYPTDHGFEFYELDIERIFFLNSFGGDKPLTVEDYLAAQLGEEKPREQVIISGF